MADDYPSQTAHVQESSFISAPEYQVNSLLIHNSHFDCENNEFLYNLGSIRDGQI